MTCTCRPDRHTLTDQPVAEIVPPGDEKAVRRYGSSYCAGPLIVGTAFVLLSTSATRALVANGQLKEQPVRSSFPPPRRPHSEGR